MEKENDLKQIIQSCFEARYLKRFQRSGNQLFLGNDIHETIVEHSFYVALFGLIISQLHKEVDTWKLLSMCIIHDLADASGKGIHQ